MDLNNILEVIIGTITGSLLAIIVTIYIYRNTVKKDYDTYIQNTQIENRRHEEVLNCNIKVMENLISSNKSISKYESYELTLRESIRSLNKLTEIKLERDAIKDYDTLSNVSMKITNINNKVVNVIPGINIVKSVLELHNIFQTLDRKMKTHSIDFNDVRNTKTVLQKSINNLIDIYSRKLQEFDIKKS